MLNSETEDHGLFIAFIAAVWCPNKSYCGWMASIFSGVLLVCRLCIIIFMWEIWIQWFITLFKIHVYASHLQHTLHTQELHVHWYPDDGALPNIFVWLAWCCVLFIQNKFRRDFNFDVLHENFTEHRGFLSQSVNNIEGKAYIYYLARYHLITKINNYKCLWYFLEHKFHFP